MKKLIVLFAMFLMTGTGLFAATGTPITLGARAYVGASNINTGDESIGYALAYGFGGICKLGITNDLSLRAEVLGAFKGAKGSYNIAGYKFDNTIHLTYLEVPVLAEYNLGSNNGIFFGPYFAFKLNSSNDNDLNKTLTSLGVKFDDFLNDYVKDTDIGLTAGIEHNIGKSATIDLRGNYGLTHIVDNSDYINYSFALGINFYF